MMAKLHPALFVCALIASCVAAAGCSRLSASTVPEPPALDVPAPPPRVVEVIGSEPPPPGTLVDPPASGAPSNRRPPPRTEVAKPPVSPKPEPAPPPAPVTETVPPPEPARPATTLATTPPEREAALEREIKTKLDRAQRDLAVVDYGRLSADAKAEYDRAKRFTTQSEEALKAKNLVFARQLADNAANIAAQLANR